MILASLALAVAVPPAFDVVDRTGSRVDMLGVRGLQWWEPREPSAPHCSEGAAPRWCVSASRDDDSGWTVTISNAETSRSARVRLPAPEGQGARLHVLSQLFRGADGSIMAGVTRTDRGVFSGGGWQKDRLILFRVTTDTEAIVLDLPVLGSASIRACFDERDRRRRRDACTDDYSFTAGFALDTDNASTTPALNVWTNATIYPGRRSRSEDFEPKPGAPPPGPDALARPGLLIHAPLPLRRGGWPLPAGKPCSRMRRLSGFRLVALEPARRAANLIAL